MSKLQTIRTLSIALILSVTLLAAGASPALAREKPEHGQGTAEESDKDKKNVKPLTYDECVAKYSKVTDYTKLQDVINKLSDKKIDNLTKLKDKVNERTDKQLSPEYKTKLVALIDASIQKVTQLKDQSAKTDSASALVKNMCDLYTTSVYRKQQAKYLIALGSIANIDGKINEVLKHKANKDIDGPLKEDAKSRLEEAKKLVAANEAFVAPIMKSVINAKSAEEVSAAFTEDQKDAMVSNIKRAVRLHTESWAVRALGRQLNPTADAKIVGDLKLLGKDGKPIPDDSAGRPAVKVVAEIKVDGKTYTKEVIRDDKVSRWRYSKPDNSDDNETLENELNNINNDKNPPKDNNNSKDS